MNCNEYLSLQSQFIDGELEEDAALKVRAHLDACPLCMEKHKAMEQLVHALHQTADAMADIAVPEGLEAEILQAVRQKPEKKESPVWLTRIFSSWQLYSVAAACMLVFTVLYSGSDARLSRTGRIGYTVAPPEKVEMSLPGVPALLPEAPAESPAPSPKGPGKAVTGNSYVAPRTVVAPEPAPATPAPTQAPFSFSFWQGTGRPSIAAGKSTPSPAASTANPPEKTPATSYKTYATVGSLVKRGIVFLVDDPGAASVFQSVSGSGEHAVRQALAAAGYDFSTREIVLEEYADQYNALVREANTLSEKIAKGKTNLSEFLTQKEREMRSLKNACATPVLQLAYQ